VNEKMKKEELEQLKEQFNLRDKWLDEEINEGGCREDELGVADFEFTKTLIESGGLDAVDAYLNATWYAWICATELTKVVDSLFPVTKFGTEDKEYGRLTTKAVKEVFESMILAFENTETEVQYDDDPLYRAEGYIRGFGYSMIDDINSMIEGEVGRVAKAMIDEFGRPFQSSNKSEDKNDE